MPRVKRCQREVFSTVIAHLKECILEEVRRQSAGIRDSDVLYVLTVPAIWSDAAKQFMREAATAPRVGIKASQLQLVLEPEAASVFCRARETRVVRDSRGETRLEPLEVGHQYIIMDLGGGTVDIASHKIIEDCKLHELDFARGDNLGGQLFNERFIIFLGELFGERLFKQWASSKHGDYLRLLRSIEGVKWEASDSDEDVLFEIPDSFIDYLVSSNVASVQEHVSRSVFANDVEVISKTQFLLKSHSVRYFFNSIVAGVIRHVRDISKTLRDKDTVFVVGGLAKSSYVRRVVQVAIPQYTFNVPEDPGMAVLKGAVLLGNKPQTIAGRISKYSYGIGVTDKFIEGKHDERYKFTRDGEVKCDDIFRKLITKGQVLKYGDEFTTTTVVNAKLPETKHMTFKTSLHQSTSVNPVYTTEPSCSDLGCIREHPPRGGWPDYSQSDVKIVVGESEFRFYVNDMTGGRNYETTVDFLSQR